MNNMPNIIPKIEKPRELLNLPLHRRVDDELPNYDSLSFNEAFSKAFKSGVKTFKWRGKFYGTRRSKDWKERWSKQTESGPKENNSSKSVDKTDIKSIPIQNKSVSKQLVSSYEISPSVVSATRNNGGKPISTRRSLEDIYAQEETYNNLESIFNAPHSSNYIIIDKANGILSVYSPDSKLLTKTNITTGRSGDDYNTVTKTTSSGDLIGDAGNMSTPAGITTITSVNTYHGSPSYTRGRYKGDAKKAEDIASSMHFDDTSKIHDSNGCVRIPREGLRNISKFINKGTMIYTLPEKPGSRFVLREGKLNYVADKPYGDYSNDPEHKYWRDYNTYTDKSYSPVKFESDKQQSREESKFVEALSNIKNQIQKEFGFDSKTYNELAKLAIGIVNNETKFGTSKRYALKETPLGRAAVIARNIIFGDHSSRGWGQIKMSGDTDTLQNLYRKYKLNESNVNNAQNSALATMLRLGHIYTQEVKGRNFVGENGQQINPNDALLYKWMGYNRELTNHTATPDRNIYIRNAKNFSQNYKMYN